MYELKCSAAKLFVPAIVLLTLPQISIADPTENPNYRPVAGDYDEQITQTNSVDFTATGSSLSDERFGARVEEAYLRNFGGVIDGSILGGFHCFGVANNKTLRLFTNDLGIGAPTTTAVPISGSGSFAITDLSRSGSFGFGGVITGAAPGEQIIEVGVTALSSAITTYPNATIEAVLDNGTRLSANSAITETAGSGDTFFGFTAPAGRFITDMDVNFSTTNSVVRLWLDDIGFRTGIVADHRAELSAAVDAQATDTGGGNFTVQNGGVSLVVQNSSLAGIDRRGILEFDTSTISGPVEVTSALLELDINLFSSTPPSDFPLLQVIGYEGDSLISVADATRTGPTIGQRSVEQGGHLAISLDESFVETIINDGFDLGLLLRSPDDGLQAGFWTTEATFNDLAPTLTVEYNIVPEPSASVLAFYSFIAMAILRISSRRSAFWQSETA